jgi:hypothetical protein
MSQFQALEQGIEVNGQTILSVVKGASVFESTARKILAKYGLEKAKDLPDAWYPQQAWLDTFHEIQNVIGKKTMFIIGKKIPESAVFPPHIKSVEDALAAIDVAYHLNHRKNGQVMFDLETGKMLDGIGHYEFKPGGGFSGTVVCKNPYPCSFDRGIITTMADRFSAGANVTHDDSAPCRETGADSCTYQVTWSSVIV